MDETVAFTPLTASDIEQVFRLLLAQERRLRDRLQYSLDLPRHKRLGLQWDESAVHALARDPYVGGYSANPAFARMGASKCEQTLQYWLHQLEKGPKCPGDDYVYHLKGGHSRFVAKCVAKDTQSTEAREL
jgi:ATP-dependent Clp protease ATP-binding subunit ClpA